VCYHGGPAGTVYEGLGQCEVVQVALDAETAAAEFTALLESFFASFVRTAGGMQRPDPQVCRRGEAREGERKEGGGREGGREIAFEIPRWRGVSS